MGWKFIAIAAAIAIAGGLGIRALKKKMRNFKMSLHGSKEVLPQDYHDHVDD